MASSQTEDNQAKNKLQWPDEMTRFLLELITLEKQAGHSKGKNLSEQGKQNVIKEFKKQYPTIILTWNKIKNKLDTLKKQYELYRKITYGSTGLGYNDRTGCVDAADHWWRDKIKAYPEAAKLRSNPLRFIPLLNVVFREETVVVEESWQPRRGAHRRPPPMELSDNDCTNIDPDEREATMQNDSNDHVQLEDPDWLEQHPVEDTQNLTETDLLETPRQSSFAKAQIKDASHNRKRKRNAVDSTLDRIAATMEERNGILEHMASSTSKTQSSNSTEECMALVVKCVRGVPDLVPMTELYWASLDLIATNDVVRGLFLALPDDEKLPFLKRQTKGARNDFFDD